MTRYLSVESIILITICLADMFSTMVCVMAGLAVEQNPLMAACMSHGMLSFAAAKILSFLPFIVAVEYYRRQNPIFARNASRAAIALYVLVYAGFTLGINAA